MTPINPSRGIESARFIASLRVVGVLPVDMAVTRVVVDAEVGKPVAIHVHVPADERLLSAAHALATGGPPALDSFIDRNDLPPIDFWRTLPCGHPPDPVAARIHDRWACHCGHMLDPADPAAARPESLAPPGIPPPPGPIVFCSRCGCHVALSESVRR